MLKFNNILFELKEGLLISLKAVKSNKIRSVLTTLGIIIGVWAVVTMSTAITGIDISFQKGVASLGSDNIYIDKWSWFNNDVPWWELRNRKNISMEDYKKFEKIVKLPKAVAPSTFSRETLKFEDNSVEFINITGTTSNYINTTNLSLEEGRFFNEIESNGGRNVIVLGSEVAKKLFPFGNGLNRIIKVGSKKFKVVGVLEKTGSWVMGNWNPDNQAYIPIEAMFKYYKNASRTTITINVRANKSAEVPLVVDEAISAMRIVRGLAYNEKNDFSINQQDGLLSQIDKTVGVVQIGGIFLTGLALFVGAIGIMNIMFVSVKERTKEIGIRKAIGAKSRSILGQFISESAILCLLGGLIGLFFAFLSSMIMSQYDFPSTIKFSAVILGISISVITGVLSGLAPAYKAAKLDPVEALRYE